MGDPCETDFEHYTGPYFLYVIPIAVVAVFQILLLIHTIYWECTLTKSKNAALLRILYITLQFFSLFWICTDILRYSIDPHTHFLQHTVLCKGIAYVVYYVPVFFYFLYLLAILHRLEISFKDSCLALSRTTLCTLGTLVAIVPVLGTGCLVIDDMDLDCIGSWNASDLTEPVTYCVVPNPLLIAFKYHIFESLVALICILNITFVCMFTFKLRVFVKMETGCSQKRNDELRGLIRKNVVLSMVGSFFTVKGFCGWFFTGHMLFMYTDSLVNCAVIGLMFSHNDWWYNKLCALCIILCFEREIRHPKQELVLASVTSSRK